MLSASFKIPESFPAVCRSSSQNRGTGKNQHLQKTWKEHRVSSRGSWGKVAWDQAEKVRSHGVCTEKGSWILFWECWEAIGRLSSGKDIIQHVFSKGNLHYSFQNDFQEYNMSSSQAQLISKKVNAFILKMFSYHIERLVCSLNKGLTNSYELLA